ncbi:MAG: sugar ABC transporter substrate-binding protein [bacterium]|nr:sugar ABC transporter substrate-binding protein [bacterium]
MKKLLTSLIILSSIFLCGCGQKQDDRTVLKFSSWGSRTEYGILKQVIQKYETQNPDVEIEFIHVPENYFRKLHLLYASKTEPDVVFLNNTYAPLYIKAGLLEDLSGKFDENKFFESSINCFKYDGKLFAIPRDVSNLVLYVNKNLVKNPQKIKTLDDLKKIAKSVTKDDVFGLNYEENPLFWLYYLEYFGGGILSSDGQNAILNSPESIIGVEFYADLINKDKSVPQKWQMSSMTSALMFIGGKTALYLSGRWLVPKFRESVDFDWDIIPFPSSNVSKTLTDASGWAVSKSSKNKNEAIKFVQFLSSDEVSKLFAQTGLITPANRSIAYSEAFLAPSEKPHNSKVFLDILENSKPTPVNSNYAKIVDEVTKNITPVFNGKKQTKDVLTIDFTDRIQKLCLKSR